MGEGKEEIMEATFRALSEHGYADLSIQRIADQTDKSKSSIYYHYDDKQDLLLSFLDFLRGNVEEMHEEIEAKNPKQRLDKMLDTVLGIESEEQWMVHRALLDLRAQASRDEEFAEKFRKIDDMIVSEFEEILEEVGVSNPRDVAEVLVSCIGGAAARKVSTGDREGLEDLKADIRSVVADGMDCDCL